VKDLDPKKKAALGAAIGCAGLLIVVGLATFFGLAVVLAREISP
jgi:hypothetical protein